MIPLLETPIGFECGEDSEKIETIHTLVLDLMHIDKPPRIQTAQQERLSRRRQPSGATARNSCEQYEKRERASGADHSPNENERSHGAVSRRHQTSHIEHQIEDPQWRTFGLLASLID